MSLAEGSITFREFFRSAYDDAIIEPVAGRFRESSKNGDREGMIRVLLSVPSIGNLKVAESYKGKNDTKAAELYEKVRKMIAENGDEHEEQSRACSILTEALFAASASSRLFLDALLDCAKLSYNLKAFAKCLKYCECMLALPASFYNQTAETANHFSERRKECVQLERECVKKLESESSQKKKSRRKQNENRATTDGTATGKHVTTMPTLEGKRHANIKNCSDAVALRFDEKRGRHLVAARNIKAGSVLIIDQPFSFSTDVEALDRNCLHCHVTLKSNDSVKIPCHHCQTVSFCSEKCRKESWQMYHRYECPIFGFFYENDSQKQQRQTSYLLLAYRTTIVGALSSCCEQENGAVEKLDIPFLNDTFLQYHTANTNDTVQEYSNTGSDPSKRSKKFGLNEKYNPRDYHTVLQLETHCSNVEPAVNLIRTIEAIFLTKCFVYVLSKMDVLCLKEIFLRLAVAMLHHLQTINCNAYEIVENVHDQTSRVWEPRYVGGAIYPTVSLVNHSCYPNVVRHSYASGAVVVRTLRFIGKGAEILDCYGPHFLSEGKLTRREYLWKKYRFLCACDACTQNWQFPLPETVNYKCRVCSEIIDTSIQDKKSSQKVMSKCPKCHEKIDSKKLDNQFRKSVEKRLNAITKMYDGQYEEALPLLLDHVNFTEKFLAAPNIETIKTQQCIIQCYNYFGCTSK